MVHIVHAATFFIVTQAVRRYMANIIRRGAELAVQWPGFMYRRAREDGLTGIYHGLEKTSESAITGLCREYVDRAGNIGTPVWERDWDVLLILDACRTDLMREVANEYSFIATPENVGTHWSVASKSSDWLRRTFTLDYEAEIRNTAYITGNPFTAKVPLDIEPAIMDEVWKYAWDDDLSTIPSRPLTDRAIDTWRDGDVDRMIVHYMQPHGPFIPEPELGEYGEPEDFGHGFGSLWGRVGKDISKVEVWDAYRKNLKYVLDDVELLLDNLDADTVAISADHGNAVGEFGLYGHPWDVLLPSIRRVPWVETTANDTETHQPTTERKDKSTDVENRLRDLGYTE